MLYRTQVLTCAFLFGLAASAGAQTQSAAPPAATPPATSAPAASAPAASAPAAAPAAKLTRIRGTITAVAPHKLTINSRDGSKLDVTLTDPLTVVTVKRVALSQIKDGDYLGVASRSGPNGTSVALEVLVFPEAMRGAGAGHYAWDLQPGSMMTNAPVSGVATQKTGRNLTLTYKDGSTTVYVPPNAPVVTFAPASFNDLKKGRKVFVIAHDDAEGHLAAPRVTVGTHGVNPPM